MSKEVESLSKTLAWAIRSIAQSGPDDREYIARAYRQAQQLVASIHKDNGGAQTSHYGLLRTIRCLPGSK
ncbi:hypothetical protein [Sinorhizobium meliloti]|uniref:hypothetical protein n=1 Tax=Rhizobium meliloti TaxID=382 RepID=UPI0034E8C10A